MIGVTRDGHVMTLEMQRAERRNALNGELVDGLREAVEKAGGSIELIEPKNPAELAAAKKGKVREARLAGRAAAKAEA